MVICHGGRLSEAAAPVNPEVLLVLCAARTIGHLKKAVAAGLAHQRAKEDGFFCLVNVLERTKHNPAPVRQVCVCVCNTKPDARLGPWPK